MYVIVQSGLWKAFKGKVHQHQNVFDGLALLGATG